MRIKNVSLNIILACITNMFFCYLFYVVIYISPFMIPVDIAVVILSIVVLRRLKTNRKQLFLSYFLIITILFFRVRDMKGLDSLPETFGFFSFIIPQAIIYLSIYNVGYNVCIFEKPNTASGLTPGIKYIKKASHDTKCFLATLKGKDIDTLLSSFSIIMTINNTDELEQQIQNSFDFLDGAITRYELEDITTSEHCNEESRELDFYCCYPKYLVKTDTNKEYSFTFCYHCLWTKHEDCTGIGSIRIEDKVSGESIAIGDFEYPYGDY